MLEVGCRIILFEILLPDGIGLKDTLDHLEGNCLVYQGGNYSEICLASGRILSLVSIKNEGTSFVGQAEGVQVIIPGGIGNFVIVNRHAKLTQDRG